MILVVDCAGGYPLVLGITPLFTISHFKGCYNHFALPMVYRLGKVVKVHVLPRFVRYRGRSDDSVDVLCNVAVMAWVAGVVSHGAVVIHPGGLFAAVKDTFGLHVIAYPAQESVKV